MSALLSLFSTLPPLAFVGSPHFNVEWHMGGLKVAVPYHINVAEFAGHLIVVELTHRSAGEGLWQIEEGADHTYSTHRRHIHSHCEYCLLCSTVCLMHHKCHQSCN